MAADGDRCLSPAEQAYFDDVKRRNWEALGHDPAVRAKSEEAAAAAKLWRVMPIRDPKDIPPRRWLVGRLLVKGFITVLAAPGGVGKTTWTLATGCAIASGRPLLGEVVHHPANVLFISLEDPAREFERILAATRLHHRLADADLDGRIVVRFGREAPLCMAAKDSGRIVFPDRERIAQVIREFRIEVVIVDPLVNSHKLDESSNDEMAEAARAWADLAEECGCAVLLVHHTRKGKGERGQADAARGASAILNAARVGLTLFGMDEDEADEMGLLPREAKLRVRLDPAKQNFAPAGQATWFRLVGTPLGNRTPDYPDGDEVGSIERWTPPSIWDEVSVEDCNAILDRIARGTNSGRPFTASRKGRGGGERWAGRVVMEALGMDDERRASRMLSAWLDTGLLRERPVRDPANRRDVAGLAVDDSKRPGR